MQRRLVHDKYETARWTRVLSLQQPYMDAEFTSLLADDVIAYRKHLSGTNYVPVDTWAPIFDPN